MCHDFSSLMQFLLTPSRPKAVPSLIRRLFNHLATSSTISFIHSLILWSLLFITFCLHSLSNKTILSFVCRRLSSYCFNSPPPPIPLSIPSFSSSIQTHHIYACPYPIAVTIILSFTITKPVNPRLIHDAYIYGAFMQSLFVTAIINSLTIIHQNLKWALFQLTASYLLTIHFNWKVVTISQILYVGGWLGQRAEMKA